MYLIGLSDIGEDGVDHGDEHPVLVRVPSVLDDGDNVGPLLGHVDQVATGTVRKLNSVNHAILKSEQT